MLAITAAVPVCVNVPAAVPVTVMTYPAADAPWGIVTVTPAVVTAAAARRTLPRLSFTVIVVLTLGMMRSGWPVNGNAVVPLTYAARIEPDVVFAWLYVTHDEPAGPMGK